MGRFAERLSVKVVGSTLERDASVAVALIAVQLVAAFALTWALGGTAHVPPHWFYFPILFAALRFGVIGGVTTALMAAMLAGPLVPADVVSRTPQPLSDWSVRSAFFVAIGVALPTMMRLGTSTIQETRRRSRSEDDIQRGLDRNEFVLHYQPIVSLRSGRIVGAEALLRWQHPTRGLLTPDAFIDDVERLGSVAGWVIAEAATAAARLRRDRDLHQFTVSVNVSAQNLAQPDFVAQIRTALRAAQLAPQHLCIELTETTLVDDLESIGARLQVLRSLGTRVSIDDFGTGHSTLSYVRQLPIDVIKIDQSFVRDLGPEGRSVAIVDSVAGLARDLDAVCVAEGVETEDQREALLGRGIQFGQGYLFARPGPIGELEQMLARLDTADR
ncbi:MAG: EAL domain-containing protein [Acidimicrobiales bacterium]